MKVKGEKGFMGFTFFLGVAAAAGVLMALQGTLNGALGEKIGVLEGSFVMHVIALIVVTLCLFVLGLGRGDLSKLGEAPWYSYLGGVLNVAIIYGVMWSIPSIGAANSTTAILIGQVGMAFLIDTFGLFGMEKLPFHWWRLLGIALMAIGGKMMISK